MIIIIQINEFKYVYENKSNLIEYNDFKDIQIFYIKNNILSIKKDKDLRDNYNITGTIPDDNCFFEAFLTSLNIYQELLSYYSHNDSIKRLRTFKRIKDIEWADDIIISLLTKYYNLETRIIRYDKDI